MSAARAASTPGGRGAEDIDDHGGAGDLPAPPRVPISRDTVIDTAMRLVDEHGADALTMRRLSDELGVAVTAIYWHVGNRDALLDALVDRFVAEMGTIRAVGDSPAERIVSLAETLRRRIQDRPHLIGLAHERQRTASMFQPVEQAMAAELAGSGVRGKDAAFALRVLSTHVVGSVMLERVARQDGDEVTTASVWPTDTDDPELVDALSANPDRDALFVFGVRALFDALVPPGR
ncbi:TetR family transcriptional regulator [Rhabdothermincola salaria]|uniref:TetR family transcriptional regulator n=1 Tax=Rhabdothermincola salaria TaxID=2903142 RepID=UPI001E5E1A2A|nr:TetR family transcriptional regulator [Rhabdothermincola salaria]